MLFRGHLLVVVCSVAVTAYPMITRPEGDPVIVAELNEFIDALLAEVHKSPLMEKLDHLRLPDQERNVEHGSYRLLDATARGLSTLNRLGDVSYVRGNDRSEDMIVTVTLATQTVNVTAQLMARTNSDDISFGKIYGTLEPVQVVLQIEIHKGLRPTLTSYTVNSHLHPLAERYSGKTEDGDILSIVKDAIDYGFSFVYGVNMEKVVEGALRRQITQSLAKTDYPRM